MNPDKYVESRGGRPLGISSEQRVWWTQLVRRAIEDGNITYFSPNGQEVLKEVILKGTSLAEVGRRISRTRQWARDIFYRSVVHLEGISSGQLVYNKKTQRFRKARPSTLKRGRRPFRVSMEEELGDQFAVNLFSLADGLTTGKVAERLGCSYQTAAELLHEIGINKPIGRPRINRPSLVD